jgi:hypothetical protein
VQNGLADAFMAQGFEQPKQHGHAAVEQKTDTGQFHILQVWARALQAGLDKGLRISVKHKKTQGKPNKANDGC